MTPPALVPLKYDLFPLGSIKPNGWMQHQLRLCGHGLGGHLFHFYRFIKHSTWLGGTCEYSPLNEAAPYWYNYIVPLAFSLDLSESVDLVQDLRGQAACFLEYTLKHQSSDGWLGPESTRQTRGIWARCLLLQGLMNHAIADPTKRQEVIASILKFVRLVEAMLKNDYEGYLPKEGDEFDKQWFGVARAHELSTTLQWLFDEPEAAEYRETIWSVMEMLWEGSRLAGRDWTVLFSEGNFPRRPSEKQSPPQNFQHGVNLAQGLRYPSQLYRMHPTPALLKLAQDAVKRAFQYHGTPAGTITSDEYIGGLSPTRGAELCCSVELIFSLAYSYLLYGDNGLADRAELAAYNALPAAISPDWFSHQYVTQVNQPWAQEFPLGKDEKTPFYDVCRYANVFGLEPEYPCCTVNHSTAYPKLLMNAFVCFANPSGEKRIAILHAYLLPSRLETDGISINCETNYPFVPCAVLYTISTSKPLEFFIRIPGWAKSSSTVEHGESEADAAPHCEAFRPNVHEPAFAHLYRVSISPSRNYKIAITLHADIKVQRYDNKSVSISCGPILFAHAIGFQETTRLPRNYKDQVSHCAEVPDVDGDHGWKARVRDHDLLPIAPWNIAVDPKKKMLLVAQDPWVDVEKNQIRQLPNPIWSMGASPVYIEVSAVEVEWPIKNGTAVDPGEVDTSSAGVRGPSIRTRLAPYGTAKLHIAQFPIADL